MKTLFGFQEEIADSSKPVKDSSLEDLDTEDLYTKYKVRKLNSSSSEQVLELV